MKQYNLYHVIALLSVLLLFTVFSGCSDRVTEGGAISETTNAHVKFQVDSSSSGSSDHTHHFALIGTQAMPSEYADSAQYNSTDSTGAALVAISGPTKWNLEIKNDSMGFHKTFTITEGDTIDLGTLTLGEFSTIQGELDLDISHTITEITLPGSQYSVPVDAEGKFQFDDLPPGDWSILASEYDDPVIVLLEEDESINVYEINVSDDYSDREMLQEVLEKNTDMSKSVDEVATFVTKNGKEVATIVDLSGLNIDLPGSLDGSGLPRMSQMNPIELNFSNNKLVKVPTQWGWHFDRIERLDLSNNKLNDLKESFRDMRTLKFIDLRNNNLDRIPKDWAVLTPDSVFVGGNILSGLHSSIEEWLDFYAEDNWRALQN